MLNKDMINSFETLMKKGTFTVNDVEKITGTTKEGFRRAVQLTNAAKAQGRLNWDNINKKYVPYIDEKAVKAAYHEAVARGDLESANRCNAALVVHGCKL